MISRSERLLCCALVLVAGVGSAGAQDAHQHEAGVPGWTWSFEGTAFATVNLQERRFRDFHQVDAQNWFMAAGSRPLGGGTVTVHGMASLEPFTLRDLGSSQAFQTGETFGGAPLIDYQHPHDLVMGLSAGWARQAGVAALSLRGGLVDAPALGPTPFMHRTTAAIQPTAPLSHHQFDASHITFGVVTAGVGVGPWLIETSLFRGREADENRLDLDLGPLDSWSARLGWGRGTTRAQVSVGWLEEPEATEPGDVTRLTASLEHVFRPGSRPLAVLLAWGQNREPLSRESAWLTEATLAVSNRGTVYLRGEMVDKHILEAGGLHPPGLSHPHIISTVGALTFGYSHRLLDRARHALHAGVDLTGHRVPSELTEAYGRPVSIHIFARWSFRAPGSSPTHQH